MESLNISGQPARVLNEHEVARILQLSVATMRHWRLVEKGPKWLKLGSAVRYRPQDVQAYLDGKAA